jgi:predicted permease
MLNDFRIRVRALFRRDAVEDDLADELRFHLERQIEKLTAAGVSEDEARRRARLMFGGDGITEACRDARGVNLIDHTVQDLRYALRVLRASPAFTTVALLSLALGIGATTAVFTVLDAVVMRPLAVTDPERLVVVRALLRNERFVLFNPVYEALRSRQRVLTDVAAMSDEPFLPVSLRATEPPAYLQGSFVSGSYFSVLGVQPAIGRAFTDADDQPGASCAAIISHRLWTREFNQSASVLGHVVRARGAACAIVGVAPKAFRGYQGGYAIDVWLPLRPFHVELLDNHGLAFFSGVVGRVQAHVSRDEAESQLTALYQAVEATEPEMPMPFGRTQPKPADYSIRLLPGAQGLGTLRDTFDDSLTIVFGVVVAFLLIAAVNVGNLLLARGAARTTELATRAALGAGRGRLLRQLTTEGGILCIAGAVLGALLAWIITPVLARAITMQDFAVSLETTPRPFALLMVAGIVVLVTLMVGVLPAWRLARVDLHPMMAGAGRSTTRGGQRLARQLIVAQLALSLLLVTLAGLFLRTVAVLSAIDPGFEPNHVVLLEVRRESTAPAGSPQEEKRRLASLHRALGERLATIPGVRAVGLSWLGLFGGSDLWLPVIRSEVPDDRRDAHTDFVTAGYFESVGMRIVRGRSFSDADRDGAPRVAIVNETFVRQRFPDTDPLGHAVTLDYKRDPQPPFTIVGVVQNSKYNDVRESKAEPMIWAPLAQWPLEIRAITLRTRAGAEATVTRAARSTVAETDSTVMIRRTVTLREQVDQTVSREQLLLRLASAASVLALFLAAVGLYGMLAQSVARRTHELGLRMALGASQSNVVRLVVREALGLVVLGVALGIPLALAAGYAARAFLFGIAPSDGTTLALACGALIVVALVAAFAPARRASRVEPMAALRHD